MMKRRLLTLLVALVGLTATARAENYNLWVCGTQVTSDNAADLSVIDGVSGTVSYDAATNTLTLENATLSCATSGYPVRSSIEGMTIAVVGTNSVTSTYSRGFGLYMQGMGLTITGSGSLSVLSPRAAIRFKGTLAISGGVQLTAEATSVGNYAYGLYPIGTEEHSVTVSGAGTVVRLKGRDWPMDDVSSLVLNDGLQITAPEGAYLADDKYIRVGTTMVENEWLVIMNPELEQTVEGERVMNLSRYDVDRDGAFSLADLTLLANALVGRVNYPITNLTLSSSAISLLKNGGSKLTATLLPADADLTALSWTTSNHLVATVDGAGYVTGRSAGTCTITARTLDGSNLSATCQVMVVDPSGTASDYVDLGLPSGTLWAACNLGATKPEEYGDYYAWGETTPYSDEGKTEFSWTTYKYCNGSEKSLTKYCTNSTYCDGTMDNLSELELADDVAHVVKGGYWRMPSTEQCAELIDSRYTTHAWSEMNGVNGMLITSIVPGYEGNSIFLPAAGKHTNVWYTDVNASGSYWGRTLSETAPSVADGLFFGSGYLRVFRWSTIEGYRCCGNAIRPVWKQ